MNDRIFEKVMDNLNSDSNEVPEPAKQIKKIPEHRPKFGATNLTDEFMSSSHAIKPKSDELN